MSEFSIDLTNTKKRKRLSQHWHWLANIVIAAAWLWLFRSIYPHLTIIFTREDFRTNQLLLLGIIALVGWRWRKQPNNTSTTINPAPRAHPAPLILAFGGALGFILLQHWFNINTIAAALFGLASYGLMGLWLPPQRWRNGIWAALLFIGCLPFGDFIQVFIGYPMRIATAAFVRDLLAAAGATSIGIETILVFENGISQIDVPCSGVKSLWTGMLFLIAATWVEKRALSWRWLGVALLFGLGLALANALRVFILVLIGQVVGWPQTAEILHVPLGVIGFVAACGMALGLLRLLPITSPNLSVTARYANPNHSFLLMFGVMTLALLSHLAPPFNPTAYGNAATASQQAQPALNFGPTIHTTPLQLRPGELDWLYQDGAEQVERVRFRYQPDTQAANDAAISGSMLIVGSHTWRAHHNPERCFENYGLATLSSMTHLITSNGADQALPMRILSLSNGKKDGQLSAAYWFQSADKSTDDYGTRLWAAFSLQKQPWVLVTILFDQPLDARAPNLSPFYLNVQQAAAAFVAQAP